MAVVWVLLGAIAIAGSAIFWIAGAYEIARGQRPPGILGRSLIFREQPSGRFDSWSTSKWRRNGCQVLGMAFGLLLVGLWSFTNLLTG